eukprot:TRINITY_DN2102_c0_g1_i3.p1 TRINITY_DN2102_c0_g1~~TRINITY_DN2102_c0_g1_i3.p1  ORF type:complete len:456 (-),score=109.68 TRINITY_DN2102_c0_g1_i3:624-1991(-)
MEEKTKTQDSSQKLKVDNVIRNRENIHKWMRKEERKSAQAQGEISLSKEEEDYILCKVCKRNWTLKEWKKHQYSNSHKQNLQRVLDREKQIILRFVDSQKEPKEFQPKELEEFYCYFCSVCPSKQRKEGPSCTTWNIVMEHLAGQSHRRKINKFWNQFRVSEDQKQFYYITKPQYKQKQTPRVSRGTHWNGESREEGCGDPSTDIQPIFKNLLPLENSLTRPTTPPPSPFPQPSSTPHHSEIPKPKTLVSKRGIVQNPTGYVGTKRVWGGGIIKVAPEDWIPWPIDLDDETPKEGEAFLGATPVKGHLPTPQSQVPYQRPPQEPTRGDQSKHLSLGSLPPWLRPDELKFFPELAQELSKVTTKQKNPKRIGAAWAEQKKLLDRMGQTKPDANWLPNFGRVFNSGPRRMTAMEFRQEQYNHLSHLQPQSPIERNRPAEGQYESDTLPISSPQLQDS